MSIDKLGAHLEAYIQTLPTIIALRLCGRFGTGPQCHIYKLPVELISAIEPFIVEPARAVALETWSSHYRCFEVKCDMVDDHFTHEEQRAMHLRAKLNERPQKERYPFTHEIVAMETEEHRNTLLTYVDEENCWVPSHGRKGLSWVKKVNMDLPTCIFNEHQALMRNHFGIDVWTSNVQLPRLRATRAADAWRQDLHRQTTVAYMTLPNIVPAMPVNMGTVATEASLRRFPRALNLLGLEVFVHPAQKKAVDSAPTDVQSSGATDVGDEKTAKWPQLVLLTRSHDANQ